MDTVHKVLAVACLMLVGIALSGCNTIRGMGRDIQRAGEIVQDAAASAHDSMRK